MSYRNWCFTSYNLEIWDNISDIPDTSPIKYIVFQKEKCPDTDRLHIQGYIEFCKTIRMKSVKELFKDNTMHLEKRMGTRDQARDYCMKPESRVEEPKEFGEGWNKSQGHRSDLEGACKTIIEEKPKIKDFALNHPALYVKFHKGFEKLIAFTQPDRDWMPDVYIFYGDTRTGKSAAIHELFKDIHYVSHPDKGSLWYDGYDNNETLVFNEYNGYVPIEELLEICDRYKHKLRIKGSFVNNTAKNIVFNSNTSYQSWYDWDSIGSIKRDALVARIKHIWKFTASYDPVLEYERTKVDVKPVVSDFLRKMVLRDDVTKLSGNTETDN